MILLCVYANIYHTGFWSSNVKNELPLNKNINQKFLRFENIFMKKEKLCLLFSNYGTTYSKEGWGKLHSLLVNIIQYKNNSFQPAFITDLDFVQVYTLRFHIYSKLSAVMDTT